MKKMKRYKKKATVFAVILCIAMAGCSAKEVNRPDKEAQITEAVPGNSGDTENQGNSEKVENVGNSENPGTDENAGNAGNEGTVGPAGNADATGSVGPGMTTLAKADFNGDGIEDSICAKEIDKSGMMKDLYMVLKDESGETSVKVPESVTITCYQESGTEFRISCEGLSLGTTTLDEKPAYGVLGKYLEKTMGMEKSGDSYTYTISGSEFSMMDAECHGGSAIWCKGKFYVEGKELAATWTQEYSLGKWVLTSMELPIWNLNGTNTGWGLGSGALSTMDKRNRYFGYLDEAACYQGFHTLEDYDGDGTLDRIWRERSNGESYTIHFGNGEELLLTDDFSGDRISCYVWPMTEDTTVVWFEERGTGSREGWMKLHLFEQTEEGLVRMELPEGPILTAEAVSDRRIAFYWGQDTVGTLLLDEISSFAELTVEEWLERYTTEENGDHVIRLSWYDGCYMMEGKLEWRTQLTDKWRESFAWVTEYVDGTWETTDVYIRQE